MGWIEQYLDYTKETEPKESYHLWTGISTLAAVLQKRVYTKIGVKRVYPNLYVVLVGESGKTRKTTAMELGEDLLQELEIPLCPDSISGRQAFTHFMRSKKVAKKEHINGIGDVTSHSLTAFAKELRVFLRGDLDFMADLTDLYDADRKWEYYSIVRELDTLPWAFFNLLGATAPDWIRTMIPKEAMGGGFTSRIIFIVEHSKKLTNPELKLDWRKREKLLEGLKGVQKLNGQAQESRAFLDAYRDWYVAQDRNIVMGHPPVEGPRFEGYCSRRALFVRKLSMISAASRATTLTVEKEDFEWAIRVLMEAEKKMPQAFAGQGTNVLADLVYRVLSVIKSEKRISQANLLRRFMYDMDVLQLKNIEESFVRQQIIAVDTDGKDVFYRYLLEG